MHYYQNNREVWYRLIVRGMTGDYSWYSSAGKYLALYEDVTKPATQFSLTEEQPENPKAAPALQAEAGDVKEEAPKTEEKPKAKRSPRKKAEPKAEAPAEVKEAPKAEEKPKAKRAPRKKAAPKAETPAEVKEAPKAE